jgi:predicted transcriptional regulator
MRFSVISIKPEYAEKIYTRQKIFEFRKVPPRDLRASYIVYESAPISKMTGYIDFGASFTMPAWRVVGFVKRFLGCTKTTAISAMGISEKELIEYAGGPDCFVTALFIKSALKSHCLLDVKIRPPQNWGTLNFVTRGAMLPERDTIHEPSFNED